MWAITEKTCVSAWALGSKHYLIDIEQYQHQCRQQHIQGGAKAIQALCEEDSDVLWAECDRIFEHITDRDAQERMVDTTIWTLDRIALSLVDQPRTPFTSVDLPLDRQVVYDNPMQYRWSKRSSCHGSGTSHHAPSHKGMRSSRSRPSVHSSDISSRYSETDDETEVDIMGS